jgi:hypothetical protein
MHSHIRHTNLQHVTTIEAQHTATTTHAVLFCRTAAHASPAGMPLWGWPPQSWEPANPSSRSSRCLPGIPTPGVSPTCVGHRSSTGRPSIDRKAQHTWQPYGVEWAIAARQYRTTLVDRTLRETPLRVSKHNGETFYEPGPAEWGQEDERGLRDSHTHESSNQEQGPLQRVAQTNTPNILHDQTT